MLNFASNCLSGNIGRIETDSSKANEAPSECSDDNDAFSNTSKEEALECPICFESFNIVENVPYVLWCGHTLCKNCILGLQWAVMKFPTLPVQLPLFISCPWCNLLSFRLVYKGNLRFPRKNYFLLWMVESRNGDRTKSHSTTTHSHHSHHSHPIRTGQVARHNPENVLTSSETIDQNNYWSIERLHLSVKKSLIFFVHLTSKFPLVFIFLLIITYAIPASAAILAMYMLVTILFAIPSFLILYFAYPSLDWLVREIIT